MTVCSCFSLFTGHSLPNTNAGPRIITTTDVKVKEETTPASNLPHAQNSGSGVGDLDYEKDKPKPKPKPKPTPRPKTTIEKVELILKSSSGYITESKTWKSKLSLEPDDALRKVNAFLNQLFLHSLTLVKIITSEQSLGSQ